MRIHKHRHTCKEMGHINSRLQECVQKQTHTNARSKKKKKNSNKPEITLSVHVNLTPLCPSWHCKWRRDCGPCRDNQWILIAGHRASLSPLQRGSPCLGDTLQQAYGSWMSRKGPRDTGGKKQERTHGAGGTVIPPKRVGLTNLSTIIPSALTKIVPRGDGHKLYREKTKLRMGEREMCLRFGAHRGE